MPTVQSEIEPLIPAYPNSLLRSIYEHLDVVGPFPACFRYASALTLIASCTPLVFTGPRSIGNGLPINMFALLVGPSGSRKSSTLAAATALYREATGVKRHATGFASSQGFEEALRNGGGRVLTSVSEFGNLLRSAQTGGPHANIKQAITDWYDCGPVNTNTRSKGAMIVEHTRPNIIAGINYAFLFGYSEMDDWNGGMFSRFFTAHSQEIMATRSQNTEPDEHERLAIVQGLKALDTLSSPSRCVGIENDAYGIYKDLIESVRPSTGIGNDRFDAIYQRVASIAVKIALLYEIDIRMARGKFNTEITPNFKLSRWAMWHGAQAIALHQREAQWLARRVPISDDDRVRYRVIEACERYSRLQPTAPGAPLSWLLSPESNIGLRLDKLEKYLYSMKAERVLDEATLTYRRRSERFWTLKLSSDAYLEEDMADDAIAAAQQAQAAALKSLEE